MEDETRPEMSGRGEKKRGRREKKLGWTLDFNWCTVDRERGLDT